MKGFGRQAIFVYLCTSLFIQEAFGQREAEVDSPGEYCTKVEIGLTQPMYSALEGEVFEVCVIAVYGMLEVQGSVDVSISYRNGKFIYTLVYPL